MEKECSGRASTVQRYRELLVKASLAAKKLRQSLQTNLAAI
jgi:hypothetical protein